MAKKPKILLDSSVLLAGLYSNKGRSAIILSLIKSKKLIGFISPSVIEETQRNIRKKFSSKLFSKLEEIIKVTNICEVFDPKDILKFKTLVNIKDLHILVFAKSSKSDFLITLDKKHLKTKKIQKADLPFKILTPKEFLEIRK